MTRVGQVYKSREALPILTNLMTRIHGTYAYTEFTRVGQMIVSLGISRSPRKLIMHKWVQSYDDELEAHVSSIRLTKDLKFMNCP